MARRERRLGFADDRIEHLDHARRVHARGSLARQHDGVDAVFHRIGRVADLGPRRPPFHGHRLEHLRRQDHRDLAGAGAARNGLLRQRHALQRHLQPEIATRNHHHVGAGEDLVEVLQCLRPLDLGDERHVTVVLTYDLARSPHVVGTLHEAERHQVDTERQPELQVVHVLQRDGGGGQRHPRRVDPLVLAKYAAFDHGGPNRRTVRLDHLQLDGAVRQQQVVAWMHAACKPFERRRDDSGASEFLARDDVQRVTHLQADGPATFEQAGADLRSPQILQDGNLPTGTLSRRTHARERGSMRLVRAVREVEPDDVGAGGDEGVEQIVGIGRRADGRNDLRLAHVDFLSLWARSFLTLSNAT